MTVKIRDRDRGYKALLRRLKKSDGRQVVDVGVQGKEAAALHKGAKLTNVTIASFHEFGTSGVPERSFIRSTVDQNIRRIKDLQRKLGRAVIRGRMTQQRALETLGVKIESMIKTMIESNIRPPLAPSTIARKKSAVALIDTGQLKNSITFRVRLAR